MKLYLCSATHHAAINGVLFSEWPCMATIKGRALTLATEHAINVLRDYLEFSDDEAMRELANVDIDIDEVQEVANEWEAGGASADTV